jgi:hypothetical protein
LAKFNYCFVNLGKALMNVNLIYPYIDVFSEANFMDPENPEIWALLTQAIVTNTY